MGPGTWDEIRTAYHVARRGTVSGAAQHLGVHHATVIRHIDALEARLGVKLFQRHARGYTATEAGQDLFRVAKATDDQFAQLSARLRDGGLGLSGELVVTTLDFLSPWLVPALVAFRAAHPQIVLRVISDARVFRLEYGEAHLAIRAGAAPNEPDNVVQSFGAVSFALYAARSYVEAHGMPASETDLDGHLFVGPDDAEARAPFHRWLTQTQPREAVVLRSNSERLMRAAILQGSGLGFLATDDGAAQPDLVEILPPRPEWRVPIWLVTHVDLHRTSKVQAILAHLKAFPAGPGGPGMPGGDA
ncbi:LysR family transcriptional regulator [Palleronia sediminis]|uniref:LysR family transcriptional regulator n=1 Tax=Palleronia sediminis TaxID=2547833 RepID=A0A4R6AFS5_9RHOB|nr:LysR family transcriptional regulator [Palleronia sediminis]TDL81874.1 LysR family transcriptional regulator [Palleronia sediminis]